uniref:CUB domain-containing protein n=1 Tax=Anopheles christyi TaxID=43041 RepID=A0A182JR35_9DIPT
MGYGAPSELLELGRVTPGTYCTRQYDECYRKKCRLQSPNYPGMYPRNVTCYWTIRQKVVPTCKHAMVAISQENEHKALVKRDKSQTKIVKLQLKLQSLTLAETIPSPITGKL